MVGRSKVRVEGQRDDPFSHCKRSSKSVISTILQLYNDTNSFKSPKKAGRSHKTNTQEGRIMQRTSMGNRLNTAAGIARQFSNEQGNDLSQHAVSHI